MVDNGSDEVYATMNPEEDGDDILRSLGGTKIGAKKFLGYTCDVWEVAGGTQWFYKGVVLKSEVSLLGTKTFMEATSAKFEVSVGATYFKLPDFPVQEQESFMGEELFGGDEEEVDDYDDAEEEMTKEELEKFSKMSFEEWKKLALEEDEDMQLYSDKQLREVYDMMQKWLKLNLEKE